MKLQHIFEVRRRPELNPHVNPIDVVWRYANNMDAYVTFTDIDKVGINPRSRFNTPIGIYSYPIRYVAEYTEERTVNGELRVPYRHDADYATIFEQRGRILDLNNYDSSELRNDTEKLRDYFDDWFERNFDNSKEVIKGILESYVKSSFHDGTLKELFELYRELANVKTPGGKIWAITLFLSKDLSKYFSTRPPILWTKILMNILDYDAAHDSGDGIIHKNEPTQAVHFKRNTLRIIEMMENKVKMDNPESVLFDVYDGDYIDIKVKNDVSKSEEYVVQNKDGETLLQYTSGVNKATIFTANIIDVPIYEGLKMIFSEFNGKLSVSDFEELAFILNFDDNIPDIITNLILAIDGEYYDSDIPKSKRIYYFFDDLAELLDKHSMILFYLFYYEYNFYPNKLLERFNEIAEEYERGSKVFDLIMKLYESFEDLMDFGPGDFGEFRKEQINARRLAEDITGEVRS